MNLRLAECCGSCIHVNRPKKPEDHAAHYSVAKTERWCFKHSIPTMREAVCDSFELEKKKGANPAFKRILSQNKKLQQIIEIKNYMVENKIERIDKGYYDYYYAVVDDRLCECYISSYTGNINVSTVSCKEDIIRLLDAYERHKNKQ